MIHPQPSFAAAFRELIDDISGQKPPKPRIRKVDMWHWEAAGNGLSRYGTGPSMAYSMWLAAWRQANPTTPQAAA